MAFGSRGYKDFGLSHNLTLPSVQIEPDPNENPHIAYMPEEKAGKRKKHARFAPEQEQAPSAAASKVGRLD